MSVVLSPLVGGALPQLPQETHSWYAGSKDGPRESWLLMAPSVHRSHSSRPLQPFYFTKLEPGPVCWVCGGVGGGTTPKVHQQPLPTLPCCGICRVVSSWGRRDPGVFLAPSEGGNASVHARHPSSLLPQGMSLALRWLHTWVPATSAVSQGATCTPREAAGRAPGTQPGR